MAATVLVWSTTGREQNLDEVPVAVVNNDQIITSPQPMAAGRALAGALTQPSSDQTNLDWVLADTNDAQAGLENGDYYAVLTIPKDFSKAILSSGTDDPVQGKLTLVSNGAASTTVPYISRTIADAAATSLGNQTTQGYLGQVYDGFNQIASSNQKAASSAGQVADGTGQVSLGAKNLDEGADNLAAGLGQLADGADQLQGGTSSLAAAPATWPTGRVAWRTGAQELDRGADPLAGSARTLAGQGRDARAQGAHPGPGRGRDVGGRSRPGAQDPLPSRRRRRAPRRLHRPRRPPRLCALSAGRATRPPLWLRRRGRSRRAPARWPAAT